MVNIIGRRKIFLSIAGILVASSICAIFIFGVKQGIDLKGGTLWKFSIKENTPSLGKIKSIFANDLKINNAYIVYNPSDKSFLAEFSSESKINHHNASKFIKNKYPSFEDLSFQSIGPSVGKELRRRSLIAFILVLVGISLYIAFAFRKVYKPVSSWKYGFITLATLFHDVIIPTGIFAVLGHYANIDVDTNFIVALLVIMGFSVHDTIVVFDRIRENLILGRNSNDFKNIVNNSVNQTLARSINTSLTLALVLLALYFMGPQTLKYFVLTLLTGTITGTYSSIFVASPLLTLLHKK